MSDQKIDLAAARHSLSHLVSAAILDKFPGPRRGVGPATDDGFYQDFLFPDGVSLRPEDFAGIEAAVREKISAGENFVRETVPAARARELFSTDEFKLELISDLEKSGETEFSIYRVGEYFDLCAGPHVASTADLKNFGWQLDRLAGAYWRGDAARAQMTRVYGLAFENPKSLREFLARREEAKKRDHRKLGRELDLFSISEKVGPGLILWHPKLAKAREAAENFWRKFHRTRGYDTLYTPNVGKSNLWATSGHLENFKEAMFPPMAMATKDPTDDAEYFVKPMNCPFHVEIFKSRPRSFREFPLRWNELGTVYRYEKSGELSGMLRVRGFTQDDAHIICRRDQLAAEYREIVRFAIDILKIFGFEKSAIRGYIAVRDPASDKYIGDDRIWDDSEKIIKEIVAESGIPFEIEEGGAKFYGPALDLKIRDALGREWQLSTVQLDQNLPERFDMTFTNSAGEDERPVMIHRALFGSLERFFAILIEHFGGAFPLWMAPTQVAILPVGEAHEARAREIFEKILAADFRPEIFPARESLGKRIREAETAKIPHILVVGDAELESGGVTLRVRGSRESTAFSLEKYLEKISADATPGAE